MQIKSAEHSAILLICIKLPFLIKIFVLSIFEWPFYTGFTVMYNIIIIEFYSVYTLIAAKNKLIFLRVSFFLIELHVPRAVHTNKILWMLLCIGNDQISLFFLSLFQHTVHFTYVALFI